MTLFFSSVVGASFGDSVLHFLLVILSDFNFYTLRYMETILPDMFIPDAEHIQKFGALRNPDGQCLDMMGSKAGGKAGVYFCHGQGSNQAFMSAPLLQPYS